MQAYTSDTFVLPLPAGHPFPMDKYRLLREAVQRELPDVSLSQAPLATPGELALAHTPAYIDDVLHGTLSAEVQREIGFPWSERMAERARRSVGASISAARTALREGVSLNLAGGTHHASADRGSGYCVFNDVAVAARLMQAEWHRLHRQSLQIVVIDLDVHQGNGTAAIFQDDSSVFTLSLHAEKNFPFRKVPGDLDVALPDGCSDLAYLEALDTALSKVWERTPAAGGPVLAFYLAGADPHEHDRLGRLKLSEAGLAERDRRVLEVLAQRRIPVALAMAGGYGRRIEDTVRIQLNTVRLAAQSWLGWRQPDQECG